MTSITQQKMDVKGDIRRIMEALLAAMEGSE